MKNNTIYKQQVTILDNKDVEILITLKEKSSIKHPIHFIITVRKDKILICKSTSKYSRWISISFLFNRILDSLRNKNGIISIKDIVPPAANLILPEEHPNE